MSPKPGAATTRDQFVIDEINDLAPDLVAIPGDLTVNGYRDEYKIAKVQIDRLKCPVMCSRSSIATESTSYSQVTATFPIHGRSTARSSSRAGPPARGAPAGKRRTNRSL